MKVGYRVMYLLRVDIKNFRMLKDVSLLLEEKSTVIVGRNNSGKTSLTELFRRLLSEKSPTFSLEDFSLGVDEQFWTAFTLKQRGSEDIEIREALPVIEIKLTLSYNKIDSSLGPLSPFVIDLNPDCTIALIVVRYQLEDGKIDLFFEGSIFDKTTPADKQRTAFFRSIRERIPKHYKPILLAVDPNDPTNKKPVDWPKLRALLQIGFINAQRGLDDTTHKGNDVLSKILEVLFDTAMSDSADPMDRTRAQQLEAAVQTIQEDIDDNFNSQLISLLPAFALFGYPGLTDPKLRTETTLDVRRLMNNHTKVRYSGITGVHLPEAYNGLGPRNLIFILLKLLEFFKSFQAQPSMPGVQLVFIEEPEAHLHPQMQEVFICQLNTIADVFAKEYNNGQPWPVQFVITTHSSHIANKAPFNTMRYFFATPEHGPDSFCATNIKDLRTGLSNILTNNLTFLHQYMTLTRCDLLFADKAILIEGTAERLMIPKIAEKIDKGQPDKAQLASQYITVMEVGGAYAHIFFDLLSFLELRTLIITDLDSINHNDGRKACKVSEGTRTSNACITTWFNNTDITPADLINKSCEEKTNNLCHLAYQVPEEVGRPCGRSFEDAFILANSGLFGLTGDSPEKDEEDAWMIVKDVKKSEFALKYAIQETEWTVPRYIKEGLQWLAENPQHPTITPSVASGVAPKEAETDPEQEISNVSCRL